MSKPYRGKTASEIRWHAVADFDLVTLLDSRDASIAAHAREEQERRRIMAGHRDQLRLDLDE